MKHLLITSLSNKVAFIESVRNSLKRQNLNIEISGSDSNKNALAQYFVDHFWHMPLLLSLPIEHLIDYCLANNIAFILPTRDGELDYFGRYHELFKSHDIFVMVSGLHSLQKVQDKLKFYLEWSKVGFPVIMTSDNINKILSSAYVVKECHGSGSRNIAINVSRSEAIEHAKTLESPLFQPFIQGEEYSIDVYVDKKGKSKGAIARKRELVVNGESQITTTVDYPLLENMCMEMAERLELYGHVMFQIIVDEEGNPYIVECNPRFGGASTLSVAAGLDSFYWFILESMGEELDRYPFVRSEKELTLIRYPKDLIK